MQAPSYPCAKTTHKYTTTESVVVYTNIYSRASLVSRSLDDANLWRKEDMNYLVHQQWIQLHLQFLASVVPLNASQRFRHTNISITCTELSTTEGKYHWFSKDSPCLQHPTHRSLVRDERTPSSHHQAFMKVKIRSIKFLFTGQQDWRSDLKLKFRSQIILKTLHVWSPQFLPLGT